ncbi:EpsG family protein [Albibacterium bauzanense]
MLICSFLITWKRENIEAKWLFGFFCIIVFLLPALRDISVGTDTINYIHFFQHPTIGYDVRANTEYGYKLWNSIISYIWNNKHFFIFTSAVLSLSGVFFFIYKRSPYRILSLLLFVLVGHFYLFQFSGMRQSISISFFLFALHYYIKGKDYRLIAIVFYILSISFHTTVLWCLPVILIVERIKFDKKWLYILLWSSFIIGLSGILNYRLLISMFFEVVGQGINVINRYDSYTDSLSDVQMSTYRILADMTPLTLIGTACIYYVKDMNGLLLKLFIIGIFTNNMIITYPIGFRLVIYLVILIIVVVPSIFQRKDTTSLLFYLLIILYYLYKSYSLLVVQYSSDFIGNKVIPYKMFF